MGNVNGGGAFKVGDSLGDFDNFEVGAGGEVEFFGGVLEEGFGGFGEVEKSGDLMGSEGGIVEVLAAVTGALTGDGLCNFIFYNTMFGGFLGVLSGLFAEVGVVDLADGDVHVDAVEEGAGELFLVVVDLGAGAGAFVSGVAEIAARAGVHGGDEHEVGGVGGLGVGAGDGNLFVF